MIKTWPATHFPKLGIEDQRQVLEHLLAVMAAEVQDPTDKVGRLTDA